VATYLPIVFGVLICTACLGALPLIPVIAFVAVPIGVVSRKVKPADRMPECAVAEAAHPEDLQLSRLERAFLILISAPLVLALVALWLHILDVLGCGLDPQPGLREWV
jgi:hypothetical protein